ncbi:NO-inducible flavohemoprotein [Ampullimonas aquatilis]|uniref:NO-inducible flavohemoprotein n=1 Tax=Ampullimonas aquatilis TaxID=1341549 RepID=UPI003C780EE4
MLSQEALPIVKATVPVLREYGSAITKHFYQRMFNHHPELRNLFNMGNQSQGDQPQALAAAVYAYAANIENPAALLPVLERIAQKHVSLGIQPAQYTIVGKHLLASIKEVLGDAATPAIMAAWDEAYWVLAGELIAREAQIFQTNQWRAGQAWRKVVVTHKEAAGSDCVNLYLRAETGSLPSFVPGQYLSVALDLPELSLRQIRQYSLSMAPGSDQWRITVKRVEAASTPAGMISNRLHDDIAVGSVLEVGPPAGDFVLSDVTDEPIVLLSAGVGITPMVSILQTLALRGCQQPVWFIYAGTEAHRYALRDDVEAALRSLPQAHYHVWLEQLEEPANSHVHKGRVDLSTLSQLPANASYYLCGPQGFMREQRAALIRLGVSPAQIQHEVFGPDLLSHLI